MENSYISARVLKINIGFLLARSPGFSRTLSLNIPERLYLENDTRIEHLSGDIRLTRTSEGILVQGELNCAMHETCSRCLREMTIVFPLEIEELFSTTSRSNSQFFIDEDNILDLAPLVREESLISIPHQIYCKPDCKGLCPECGQNLNDGQCDCVLDDVDPRWAALADLKQELSEDEL